jgi:hypothetical protein
VFWFSKAEFSATVENIISRETVFQSAFPSLHSKHVVTLFQFFSEKLEFFMNLPIPHDPLAVERLVKDINLPLNKYLLHINRHLPQIQIPSDLVAPTISCVFLSDSHPSIPSPAYWLVV